MALFHGNTLDVFAVCLLIFVVCHQTIGKQKLPKIIGEQYSFVRPEGDTVVFSCEKQLAEILKQHAKEKVNASVTWKHNGRPILHKKRYAAKKALFYLYHLKPKDTGLVVCEIDLKTKIFGPLKKVKTLMVGVYSVCVIPTRPTAQLTYRASINLTTNLRFFPLVDSPLNFYWYKNDRRMMYKSGLVSTLPRKLVLRQLHHDQSGLWRCIVESPSLKMIWTTSCHRLAIERKKEFIPLLIDLLTKVIAMPEFQLIGRWTMLVIFVHILFLVRMYARAYYP